MGKPKKVTKKSSPAKKAKPAVSPKSDIKKKKTQIASKKPKLNEGTAKKILLNEANGTSDTLTRSQKRRLRKKLKQTNGVAAAAKPTANVQQKRKSPENNVEKGSPKKQKVEGGEKVQKAFVMGLPKVFTVSEMKNALTGGGMGNVEDLQITVTSGKKSSFAIIKFTNESSYKEALALNKKIKVAKRQVIIREYNDKKGKGEEAETEDKAVEEDMEEDGGGVEEEEEVVEAEEPEEVEKKKAKKGGKASPKQKKATASPPKPAAKKTPTKKVQAKAKKPNKRGKAVK